MEGKVAHSKKGTWKGKLHTLQMEHEKKVKHHYKKDIKKKTLQRDYKRKQRKHGKEGFILIHCKGYLEGKVS